MSMTPLRSKASIAIDGGGIKGLIVARALETLEKELGCKPLIRSPEVRILAGTSTGAILSGALAIGMEASRIAQVYRTVGQQVFPRLVPDWFPASLKHASELVLAMARHSWYSNRKLIAVLREAIGKQTGDPDLTLAGVDQMLRPEKVLVLTVANVTERRTHFLKSSSALDGKWKLWEAILASSSVPPALPVWSRTENGKRTYYTDGGVGSYGNPAYVAAQEATAFRGYRAHEVSILSFGTGWLNADSFERQYHAPSTWRGLAWASNAPSVITGDCIRSQSLDILENPRTSGIDFRRFQFEMTKDIEADTYGDDATYALMEKLGNELGQRIADDQFASASSPQYDPEGLYALQLRYRAAICPQG